MTMQKCLSVLNCPRDYSMVKTMLPHQLRQWGRQVDEIVVYIDLGPQMVMHPIVSLIEELIKPWRSARIEIINYDSKIVNQKFREIFKAYPKNVLKDWRGTAIYQYVYILTSSRNKYLLHMDSDMIFGGGSQTWMNEALQMMNSREEVIVCEPLSGPPSPTGPKKQRYLNAFQIDDQIVYKYQHIGTRIFLLHTERFFTVLGAQIPWQNVVTWKSLMNYHRTKSLAQLFEIMFSAGMKQHQVFRLMFEGKEPGMWTLHPLYKPEKYIQKMGEIVSAVEAGNIPEKQRGEYDLAEAIMDVRPLKRKVKDFAKLLLGRS